jgi:glycosyltransferase involved in cell wall biosynthesis
MAFPADLPSIHHVVINSIASEQLSHRHGISNTVIPNVLDFSEEQPTPGHLCDNLRAEVGLEKSDLFVLQPTRVIPRKWIERSIEIVKYLNLPKPLLVISHAVDDEGSDYYQHIQDYARNLGVKIVTIDHLITEKRGKNEKGEQTYTICDMYQCADLITYPSSHEGFGNAFLEAIYYKKPIIVNPYSIYVVDIAPKGFDAILFKGFLSSHEVERIEAILKNENELKEMVEKNYQLAKKYYSYEVLEEKIITIIQTFR